MDDTKVLYMFIKLCVFFKQTILLMLQSPKVFELIVPASRGFFSSAFAGQMSTGKDTPAMGRTHCVEHARRLLSDRILTCYVLLCGLT